MGGRGRIARCPRTRHQVRVEVPEGREGPGDASPGRARAAVGQPARVTRVVRVVPSAEAAPVVVLQAAVEAGPRLGGVVPNGPDPGEPVLATPVRAPIGHVADAAVADGRDRGTPLPAVAVVPAEPARDRRGGISKGHVRNPR